MKKRQMLYTVERIGNKWHAILGGFDDVYKQLHENRNEVWQVSATSEDEAIVEAKNKSRSIQHSELFHTLVADGQAKDTPAPTTKPLFKAKTNAS